MTDGITLTCTSLSVAIGEKSILRNVNLTLRSGRVTAMVGASGSGKSMTALAIMGLIPRNAHRSGEIKLGEVNLSTADVKTMCAIRGQRISMVFQEPMTALNPLQTIGQQVAEMFLLHTETTRDEARAKARDALINAELSPDVVSHDRYPHQLSGGQRQRVMIAMAIALSPDFLIADEPTTALDVTTQKEILTLLKRLAREREMGILLITHDSRVVADIADEVATIENGSISAITSIKDHLASKPTEDLAAKTTEKIAAKDPVLSVQNVSCDYINHARGGRAERRRVVNDVSFDLYPNQTIGLVGESGSGKSTLARALLGLHPRTTGSVLLNDAVFPSPIRTDERRQRRGIQIVFQDPYGSFDPRYSVERIIAQPLNLLGNERASIQKSSLIDEALRDVGLDPAVKTKFPHQFSGGQRQRIAIARALIVNPKVLVLDEATSALDASTEDQILSLLREIKGKRELSIFFVTHDLSLVQEITDRVLVMKDGVIVEANETSALFSSPQNPYTQSLLSAALGVTGAPANL